MLRVTIELLPQGDESRARTIGVVEIANDLTGTFDYGNYDVRLTKSLVGKHKQIWKRGRVETFPRHKLGPYDLLYRALRATVGNRNQQRGG